MDLQRNAPPIVTNISATVRGHSERDGGATIVTVEANRPIEYVLETRNPRHPVVRLVGAETRMPTGTIGVYDGLLALITVSTREDGVILGLQLGHGTGMQVRSEPGIPARLRLLLDRSPLRRIMTGRRVLVDPGHGGDDIGGRGPIDLLEKNMTWAVARYLVDQLEDLGCAASLTRTGDAALDWSQRLRRAEQEKADVMVSLHTAWFPDPAAAGIAAGWLNRQGQPLALRMHAALRQKLPLPDRGVGPGQIPAHLAVPAAIVEFATISNPVEEGWLRSSTFLKRAAIALASGIKDFFAADAPPRRAVV